ncbi:DegV family protein with EDD domain [Peribacillus deserti]|uniref:DegV family protein with EDD domain n=1 Tax=Peribacillus deserti TaxID=673318 RepID=A0ABS2QED8_9BACI|nr:DegV family protein [Peribacillus deserti]MBM7690878.1 DegV family protein with EDD domain [Peribacillus deserti]
MKTAVVTDSTAYIAQDVLERYNIHMVPLNVIFGTESYREEVDITAEQFYEEVRSQKKLPTTSQPSIGQLAEKYEELSIEFDAIISIHLSSGISGTYQGSVTAGSMAENINVYSFDTEVSCMVQGFYVIEAAKMAQEGRGPEDIIKRLNEMKQTSNAYFMVDDLSNLQRGGRLSSAQAMIGSLLQIKPLLTFENKVIVPSEKIRTRKKAMKRIVELLQEAQTGEPMRAVIIHANREQGAKDWVSELTPQFPHVEFSISYFGPVIGTHLGEGAMGLGWVKKY